MDAFEPLEIALDYSFNDGKLLLQALSHRSTGSKNNERLEFLGDSILNAVISAHLFEIHSQLEEGDLTRLRASLVRQSALASVAHELMLGSYLMLGSGELKSGGQRRASILADALEAILGAIYLDSNFANVRTVILQLFKARFSAPVSIEILKDCKTQLQEALQARGIRLPIYNVESISGKAHQQTFDVSCLVELLGIHAHGIADSRRAAEQLAAQRVLGLLPDA